MGFSVSVASAADVRLMAQWAADEGWNPGDADSDAFFVADPSGFLIGRLDGRPVSCISIVRYGQDAAFLGMYISHPEVRGLGYGLQTWQAGMAITDGRVVGLDGVPAQQANYAKSGFRPAWTTQRFEGAPPDADPPPGVELVDARSVPFDLLDAYDRRHFGAPRAGFLASWITLPRRSAAVALRDGTIVGFGVLRPAQSTARIGPLFAESRETAEALVSHLASSARASAVAVDVPGINPVAVEWARKCEWTPSFDTTRMYTGEAPAFDHDQVFGITTLELG